MKKLLLALATFFIGTVILNAQTDTMYVMKAGVIIGKYNVQTQVDSIIFYKPIVAIPSGSVTDIDGNVYNTITIGIHTWMVENLKTTHYRNGDVIGTTSPITKDISGESAPKYQWPYNGDENNAAKYGRLYTWYAVADARKIAPIGWHIATDAEWMTLERYLIANGHNYDGTTTGNKIAKALAAKTDWYTNTETGAIGNDLIKNNSSGFTALPGSHRYDSGSFEIVGIICYWWSSTGIGGISTAWYRYLNYGCNNLIRSSVYKRNGFSVRCVRD